MEDDYLKQLNPAQAEAVTHHHGPLLIIAGAGAGKTKTLTHRIYHLINSGVAPENILAITFTNKAATEMRDRVKVLMANKSTEKQLPFIATFHALGVFLLRNFSQQLAWPKNFLIFDRDDSLSRIKLAMKQVGIDEKRFEAKKILSAISRHKGNAWDLATLKEQLNQRDYYQQVVATVWEPYQAMLKQDQAFDFDDLLLYSVKLLTEHPQVRQQCLTKWPYLHIDEYQDTNQIQYKLSKLLVGQDKNICVVGDTDQSIYGWRGADFTNILHFENDYPEAKTILLEENYRSTQTILSAANAIIEKNQQRHKKNLFTKNTSGQKIGLMASLDEAEEAKFVAQKSSELIANGIAANEIAVLYRTNFLSRSIEEAMLRQGLPYQVLGIRFFERQEIKDLLSFIRLAINPNDRDAYKRAINIRGKGIGPATLEKIFSGQENLLSPKIKQRVKDFQQIITDISEAISQQKCSDAIKCTLTLSGLKEKLEKTSGEDSERWQNLGELISVATKYDQAPAGEGIMDLLTELALTTDQDGLNDQQTGVKLMTVHAAKGLEFDFVFIVGLEQNLFPHAGFGDSDKRDPEEERRLFYVALTRAKKKIFLSYAQTRMIYGNRQVNLPSEFIFDIDDELLEAEAGLNDPIIEY